jgi:hypothetical protein
MRRSTGAGIGVGIKDGTGDGIDVGAAVRELTSDPDNSAEDVALGYKNLLEAERSFRDLKGILRLRPVFHRLEERIRAHILICWLALLLVRLCERQAHDTWRNLRRELERPHLVTLAGAAGQVQQTTRPTPNSATS